MEPTNCTVNSAILQETKFKNEKMRDNVSAARDRRRKTISERLKNIFKKRFGLCSPRKSASNEVVKKIYLIEKKYLRR